MCIAESAPPPHWQYYSDRAREAHLGRADHYGTGREEQLDEILECIRKGEPLTERRRGQLERLPQNRGKKYLRLLQYLECRQRTEPSVTAVDIIELRDEVEFVVGYLSRSERYVERSLASGSSYADIAAEMRVSMAAMKMRAARWRRRVRGEIMIRAGRGSAA